MKIFMFFLKNSQKILKKGNILYEENIRITI